MPKLQIPRKIERILTTKARIIVLVGGRSSGKSEGVGRLMLMKCQTEQADILCGREFQTSIDDSVHKLLAGLIRKLGVDGVTVAEKKIDFAASGIRYKGFARNPESVKSAQDFKYSWIEEAQDLSEQSIEDLLPTIRAAGSQLFFTANPQASNDPFSKRFIVPFVRELDSKGFYEDGMHLVIKMNWRDNPWHGELEQQRLWDFEHLSRAKYDHIWEGAFNDSVDDSIILPEWFDAAIDAHIKLGIKPKGLKIVSHDPSDVGPDPKGLCYRHGSVILDALENKVGDTNEGADWATGYAIENDADVFIWDCDGLGVSLKRQVNESLKDKKIDVVMFKGSESPTDKNRAYQPIDSVVASKERTNSDTFRNKRAQYYWRLRDRFYNTFRAVEQNEYIDPDELISVSSNIKLLSQFRSEVCRIPKKQNASGFIQIMTKKEMKDKYKIASPNLADSAMMSMEMPDIVTHSVDYRDQRNEFRSSDSTWMR